MGMFDMPLCGPLPCQKCGKPVDGWQSKDGECLCEEVPCDDRIRHIWSECTKCGLFQGFRRKSVNDPWEPYDALKGDPDPEYDYTPPPPAVSVLMYKNPEGGERPHVVEASSKDIQSKYIRRFSDPTEAMAFKEGIELGLRWKEEGFAGDEKERVAKVGSQDSEGFEEMWEEQFRCTLCEEKDILRGYKFCPNCGAKIEWVK